MIEIIYGLIALNILTAASTAYFWRKARSHKDRPDSVELQEFLMDLRMGGGMVHIRRIAPEDVVIRSRRNR